MRHQLPTFSISPRASLRKEGRLVQAVAHHASIASPRIRGSSQGAIPELIRYTPMCTSCDQILPKPAPSDGASSFICRVAHQGIVAAFNDDQHDDIMLSQYTGTSKRKHLIRIRVYNIVKYGQRGIATSIPILLGRASPPSCARQRSESDASAILYEVHPFALGVAIAGVLDWWEYMNELQADR